MEYYGIWAVRGSGSVMGPAEAWSKRDGVPEVFTTKADAEAQAERYNKSTASVHVRYYVKEMEPELAKSALLNMEKAATANNRAAMLDVIGQFEKSRNLSDRNRMTWFHNDFGEFRANPGVTDEQIAARYGEVLEIKLEREQKRSAAAVPDNVHGYEIKQAVCFSNDRGFALAENPRAASPFVTWQFTEEIGKRDYYWGHYFAKVESAEKDYSKRADEYRVDYPTLTEKYNYLAAAEMSTEQNYNMIDERINKCKFCSLYHGECFRMSPMNEFEEDLAEIKRYQPNARRMFWTGANPFAMSYENLKLRALTVRDYLIKIQNIAMFASIRDIKPKSVKELRKLWAMGINGLSIGMESGDDETLALVNKGYTAADIVEQLAKLDEAGIEYYLVYMTGLAGKENGKRNALTTAKTLNQISPYFVENPFFLNIDSLTLFPNTELYQMAQSGEFVPAGEKERLEELISLLKNLRLRTRIQADTVSNFKPIIGVFPKDRDKMIEELQYVIDTTSEEEMTAYRNSLKSL